MAENSTSPTNAAPAATPAPNANSSITLSDDSVNPELADFARAGVPAANDAPPATATTEAKPEDKKPETDVDELVLQLHDRGRKLTEREKALSTREQTVKAKEERNAQFEGIIALAQKSPLEFVEKMADAVGLDVDTVVEAYTAAKTGGNPTLTAEQQIQRLQAQIEELKNPPKDDKPNDDDPEADRLVQQHVDNLKALAKAGAANFPLFARNADRYAPEAFDLMVLRHNAGAPITAAAAIAEIEKQLRIETEGNAEALGFSRPQQNNNPASTNRNTPTTPNGTPRPSAMSAAPIADVFHIRSDDDIAADFLRQSS